MRVLLRVGCETSRAFSESPVERGQSHLYGSALGVRTSLALIYLHKKPYNRAKASKWTQLTMTTTQGERKRG